MEFTTNPYTVYRGDAGISKVLEESWIIADYWKQSILVV